VYPQNQREPLLRIHLINTILFRRRSLINSFKGPSLELGIERTGCFYWSPKNGRYSEANKITFCSIFTYEYYLRLSFQKWITLQVAGHNHCNWLPSNHDISNSTCCFHLLLRLNHTARTCEILPNMTIIAQYVADNSSIANPPPPTFGARPLTKHDVTRVPHFGWPTVLNQYYLLLPSASGIRLLHLQPQTSHAVVTRGPT
jgi:hypothetical protein